MSTYPVGAFFLTTVTGPAGVGIDLGQFLCRAPSRYQHAGIIVTPDGGTVEAEPHGAREGHLSDYAGRPTLICDGPVQTAMAESFVDHRNCGVCEESLRSRIADEARKLLGTPYSWLDYAALAALHLHLPDGAIRRRVQESGHMICSQLVDAVYARSGLHLWSDDRLPGDVMPADLANWADDYFSHQRAQVAS